MDVEGNRMVHGTTSQPKAYSFERYGRRAFGNNITNRQTLDGRQDVLWKKEDVAVTPTVRPRADVVHTEDVFQTPLEEGNDGPASEGKRLAKEMHAMAQRLGTPSGRGSLEPRSLASASTEELKRPLARRMSILADMHAPILDLNGFDAHGERRRHSLATPVIQRAREDLTVQMTHGPEDVEELKEKIAALEAQRDEAGAILEGYQGSIAKLQDDYSKDVVTWTTENTLMSTEVERLRKERQQIHDQFSVLYHSKYLPLKEEIKGLREASAKQESIEVASLCEEVGMLKTQVESYKMSENAAKNDVRKAKEEARLAHERAEEYQSRIESLESALRQKDERLDQADWKIGSMREQLDEALHQKEVATAGFQRISLELQAREDEVCRLKAHVTEKMKLLEEYKRTNEGFYEIKLGYKKKIQYLNAKLAEKMSRDG